MSLSPRSLLLAGAASAAEVKVLASGAIKEAYLELIPQFEKASEHKVTTTLGRHRRHQEANGRG